VGACGEVVVVFLKPGSTGDFPMKCAAYVLATCVLFLPALARAQDFGVVESAETIDKGNFKLRVNPILIFADGDKEAGIAGAAGYGFTDSFDAEVKVAFYDGVTIVGGDVEFWLVKHRPVDLSVSAGFHFSNSEFSDQTGVDATIIGSHGVTPKLDIYAAIDLAFNRYRDALPDRNYTQAHLVPGIEYKIHANLDLVAEVGIALNDNGNHYISGGIAYYLR
jgi:hypothetical protein